MPGTLSTTELQSDQQRINAHLVHLLHQAADPGSSRVSEAMAYAVLGPGQRLRPVMALRVARAAGADTPAVLRAAAAVELLHCASLVIDDLPCMDDEAERRDRPTVHVAFGEATAVLAAFALVSLAARSVLDRDASLDELLRIIAFQERLLGTLDCCSLIGGQAMDLGVTGATRESLRDRMNELKTVPLFELAAHAGLLAANVRPQESDLLVCFGQRFGQAYQLVDDYLDGEPVSSERASERIESARKTIAPLGARARELEGLLDYLHARAWQKDHRHR